MEKSNVFRNCASNILNTVICVWSWRPSREGSVSFCAKFLFIVRSGPPLVGLLSLTEPHWPLTRLSAGLGPSLWPRYAWHRPGPAWAGNWSISRPTFEGTQPHTPPGQGDAKMLECSRWWGTESWRWLSFKCSTFLLIQCNVFHII